MTVAVLVFIQNLSIIGLAYAVIKLVKSSIVRGKQMELLYEQTINLMERVSVLEAEKRLEKYAEATGYPLS